jgi:hypothetical protein
VNSPCSATRRLLKSLGAEVPRGWLVASDNPLASGSIRVRRPAGATCGVFEGTGRADADLFGRGRRLEDIKGPPKSDVLACAAMTKHLRCGENLSGTRQFVADADPLAGIGDGARCLLSDQRRPLSRSRLVPRMVSSRGVGQHKPLRDDVAAFWWRDLLQALEHLP